MYILLKVTDCFTLKITQVPLNTTTDKNATFNNKAGEQHLPLWLDVGDSTDVVLGGEHKFIVQHPFWFVVEHGGWVELNHLVVLHCEVVASPLQVGHLNNRQNHSCHTQNDHQTQNPAVRQNHY